MNAEPVDGAGPRTSAPVLGVLIVLIAVALSALALRVSPESVHTVAAVTFDVPDWRLTSTERKTFDALIAKRAAVKVDPAEPATARLLSAYAAFNRSDLKARGSVKSALFQDAYAAFQQRANDHFLRRGRDGYVAAGQWLADRFLEALAAGDKKHIVRYGGSLYRELRSLGLVTRARKLRAGTEALVRVMLMHRWAQILREHRVVSGLVHPVESELLLRWKLAANPVLSLKRRLEVARALMRLKTRYPLLEALAARSARSREWKAAVHFYREALKRRPDDPGLKARLEVAERRLVDAEGGKR